MNEWLLYLFAIAFVTAGLWGLVYSVLKGQQVSAVAGCVSSALCLPAVHLARSIRKENIAIRLLEFTLSKAETEKEAAQALHRFVSDLLESKPEKQGSG